MSIGVRSGFGRLFVRGAKTAEVVETDSNFDARNPGRQGQAAAAKKANSSGRIMSQEAAKCVYVSKSFLLLFYGQGSRLQCQTAGDPEPAWLLVVAPGA